MAKRVSARNIKANWQYTYDAAADALNVTPQTVRLWRKEGLPVLDSQKPHLILGFALKDFLNSRVQKKARHLAPDEFLCMACDAPRRAYGGMADYVPFNDARGRLVALCEVCETPCGKFATPKTRDQLGEILSIATRNTKAP